MITARHTSAALAAIAFATTPALAQDQAEPEAPAVHTFTVGQARFTVPVPDGYCLPEGASIAAAEAIAALDKSSITHATFDRCGSFGEDYTHIKTPIQSPPVLLPKAAFVALLAREIQTANGRETMAAAMKQVEGDIAESTNNTMAVSAKVPTFGGQDEHCAYMVSTLDVTVAGSVRPVRVGSCLTVVGTQFFAINSYAPADSGITEDALKARSGAVGAALSKAP